MAGVAGGQLAAALSAAGALGMIGVGAQTTPEWVGEQCETAAAVGFPFGVGLQAWVLDDKPGQLDAALAGGASLVSVSYGSYSRHLPAIRRAGIPVATTIGNLAEALAAQRAGVDVIVARGAEGGGHGRNDVATLPLLQSVLESVSIPVLAAGGIGTARDLAAVLAAGAAGAWVGTAFLTCLEGTTSRAQRARMVAATDTDTVYGRVFDVAARAGWPVEFGERALGNRFFDRWTGHEVDLANNVQASDHFTRGRADDDIEVICIDAGQGVVLLTAEVHAARWSKNSLGQPGSSKV